MLTKALEGVRSVGAVLIDGTFVCRKKYPPNIGPLLDPGCKGLQPSRPKSMVRDSLETAEDRRQNSEPRTSNPELPPPANGERRTVNGERRTVNEAPETTLRLLWRLPLIGVDWKSSGRRGPGLTGSNAYSRPLVLFSALILSALIVERRDGLSSQRPPLDLPIRE
jgi:hypothetical protein